MGTLQNYLLRRFTHPLYPSLLYGILGALISWIALRHSPMALGWALGCFVAGIFTWTLVEYVLHRFIFHLVEIKEPWRTIASGLHMAHHHAPNEPHLIVAPPLVSFAFAALLFFAFWGITQNPAAAALMLSGLFFGYCFYEWVHYADHVYPMRSRMARFWKKYHLQHHHKHPNLGFGVTTSLWDHIFGTYPFPRINLAAQDSPAAK